MLKKQQFHQKIPYNLLQDNPFFLHPGNINFINGITCWTQQTTEPFLYIFIATFFGSFFLLFFFRNNEINLFDRLSIVGVGLGISIIFINYFLKKYQKEILLATKGTLIIGSVQKFVKTHNGPSDSPGIFYYKVGFIFTSPTNKLLEGECKVPFPKDEKTPVGRPVLILYLDDRNFTAL